MMSKHVYLKKMSLRKLEKIKNAGLEIVIISLLKNRQKTRSESLVKKKITTAPNLKNMVGRPTGLSKERTLLTQN